MLIDYFKIRPTAKDPVRANPSDAGLDIFYCPEDSAATVAIHPGESAVLGTGLKFGVPHGFMLEVKNRSSMAAKKSLVVGACVIDPGYNGEVFINLLNVGKEMKLVTPGDKIAQLVLIPVVHFRPQRKMSDVLYDSDICISNRGSGGFGSTGG